MKLLFTFILLSAANYVYARYLGIFGLQCVPYCSGGRVRSGARGVCANMCYSVRSGTQPGTLTYNPHRGEDRGCSAYNAPGHRGVSPCGVFSTLIYKTRTGGNTCDEYPFASTYESGGNTSPRRPANLRCVPGSENSSGGQQLAAFQARNGAQNRDTYSQGYFPPPAGQTIPFCLPASSTNDGTEFKYTGPNTYVNARRSLAPNSDFSDAGDIAMRLDNSTVPQPVYRTSSNQTIVLFKHVDIGERVWGDAHGSQTIVEKVHDDFGVYWEELNRGFNPEDAPTEPTVDALQC